MKFSHDFRADLETLLHEIEHGEPFAFVRFADGERAILEDRQIATADGWKIGDGKLNHELRNAINDAWWRDGMNITDYYVGIGCPCCDRETFDALYLRENWKKEMVPVAKPEHVTFSNLFVNANYDRAFAYFGELAKHWCVVSSAWGSDIRVPADWSRYRDFDLRDMIEAMVKRMRRDGRPLLVAAGPLGKVLIHQYWFSKPHLRTAIDIGSLLDPLLHGRASRSYHDPNHPNRSKVCQWTA